MSAQGNLQLNNRERFVSICQAIWGKEWQRQAAAHLGVAVRTIVYWANLGHEPREGWDDIMRSLLGACGPALTEIQKRQAAIVNFKKTYAGGGR